MRASHFTVGSEEYVVLSADLVKSVQMLTPAEQIVLKLVLEARSNREIAKERGTSERTIANQLASIFRKTGTRSRGELVARLRSP